MAELSVEISANIKQLRAALKTVENDLKQLGGSADKNLAKLDKPLGSATKGVTNLGKATSVNATPALQEFSRVIQDAPFGIMGVGNNITQLVSNFGNLSKSAGGAKAAVSAMIGSLAGPGGVLFAVSTVVTLLTVFGDKLFNSKSKAEELAEETKKAAEALDKYVDSLSAVNKATVKGQQSAAEEITTLRLLRGQIENTTLTTEERKDGILKLRKEFPAYFQDVKDEQLLNGQAASSYDTLTNSIIKRAKATAAQDLLIQNAKKEIALNSQLDKLKEDITNKQIDLTNAQQKGASASTNTLVGGAGSYNAKLVEQGIIQKGINDLNEEQLELQKQIGEITKENTKLSAFVTDNVIVEPKEVKLDTRKSKVTAVKPEKFIDYTDLFKVTDKAAETLASKSLAISDALAKPFKDGVSKIKPELANIELALNEFNERAGVIIEGGIADTFAGIGTAIGESIATGGNILQSLGASLLGTLGGLLIEMGKMAISVGVGLLGIKAALKTLNPAAAIGAGIALIALGSLFSSASKGLSDSIGGSGGASSSVGGQGSSGSGIGNNSNSGATFSQSGSVVFEIAGTKLVGVLNRTLDRNKRLGGNLSLT